MSQMGISQMPVQRGGGKPYLMIHEVDLLQSLIGGKCTRDDKVLCAASELQGQVSLDDSLSKVQEVFDAHNVAVVFDSGNIVGIISKIDVVGFLATRQ
jgi:cystathionine beta-synthase